MKKHLEHVKAHFKKQARSVFLDEKRENPNKRKFIDELVSNDEPYSFEIKLGATRALSRLREIYVNCGQHVVWEILGEPK